MADIRIQYFGSIRAAAQKAEEDAAIAESITVLQLLQRLADVHGDGFGGEILAAGGTALRDDLTVMLNGTILKHEASGDSLLRPGDVLALFPIFPGGG